MHYKKKSCREGYLFDKNQFSRKIGLPSEGSDLYIFELTESTRRRVINVAEIEPPSVEEIQRNLLTIENNDKSKYKVKDDSYKKEETKMLLAVMAGVNNTLYQESSLTARITKGLEMFT